MILLIKRHLFLGMSYFFENESYFKKRGRNSSTNPMISYLENQDLVQNENYTSDHEEEIDEQLEYHNRLLDLEIM